MHRADRVVPTVACEIFIGVIVFGYRTFLRVSTTAEPLGVWNNAVSFPSFNFLNSSVAVCFLNKTELRFSGAFL